MFHIMSMPNLALAVSIDMEQLTSDIMASISSAPRGTLNDALQQALARTVEARVHAQTAALLEGIGDAFYSLDAHWRFAYINRAAEAYFGLPRQAMLHKVIWDMFPESEGTDLRRRYEEVSLYGAPLPFEAEAVGRPGRHLEFHVFPYNGGVGVSFRDWTERNAAVEALRENDTRLKIATDAAEMGVWDWEIATDKVTMSDRAKAICGLAGSVAVSRETLLDTVHSADWDRFVQQVQRALDPAIREKRPFEYRIMRPDGSTAWVLAHGEVIFGSVDGEVRALRYVGTLQDITARKEAEEALRESEARLSALADNMPLGMVFQITMGRQREGRRFMYVSQNCLRVNGITPEKALEDPANLDGLILPEHLPHLIAIEAEALRDLKPMDVEVQMRHAITGEVRWFQIISAPRLLPNGWLVWDGIQNDITERKRVADALCQSEERLRTILNELPVGVMLMQVPQGDILFHNGKSTDLLGFKPTSAENMENLLQQGAEHPDGTPYQACEYPIARTLLTGEEIDQKEILYRRPDGRVTHLSMSSTLIPDPSGAESFAVSAFYDVTEQKRAETRQRLLINELNHRVKNTLATVQSLASQSFQRISPDPDSIAAARRAFESRLFALARGHDVLTRENWEGGNLREVVNEAFAAYRSLHPDGSDAIEIDGSDLWVTPPMVLSLSMALHELCTNALKYGALRASGGQVKISWSAVLEPTGTRLLLRWEEHGGPPVSPPARKGFGSRLIQDGVARELNGAAQVVYEPTGVICTIDVPLP